MRIQLFEFEDLSWFPKSIREHMTDYLRYFLTAVNFYNPITSLIQEGLEETGTNTIVDLCSGGGGAIEQVRDNLQNQYKWNSQIILTDKFPSINTYTYLQQKTNGAINFHASSVDAMDVPQSLKGFRTLFSGFHHFDENAAKRVIKNAVDNKQAIGIFDGGDKNILTCIAMIIGHPVIFFLFTPFFKPFSWSRLLFTYLIPIIPVCTVWDGVISIIRLYTPNKLLLLANEVDNNTYVWKAGKKKSKLGFHVVYLLGYPKNNAHNNP